MIIHRAIQAVYNEQHKIHTVTIIKIVDHNDVTNPNLNQEEIIGISGNMITIFRPAPGVEINERNVMQTVGMYAEREHLQAITQIMAQYRGFQNASNIIRSVLAMTVHMSTTTTDQLRIVEFEYNIICDVFQNRRSLI